MERRIVSMVPISEIVFDEELYPRMNYSWQVGYDYQQSMLSGAKFPPITLALINNKKVLVDGKHRLEANKLLKKTEIEAEVFTGWNNKKVFEEAIRRNIAHGRVLSPFEKRRLALKLKTMKYDFSQISELIQVPEHKLQNFIAQRLVNSINGEVIKETIVKSELKHLSGKTYETTQMESIEEIQEPMYSRGQINLLNELISLIEGNMLDLKDEKINERFEHLKKLLNK